MALTETTPEPEGRPKSALATILPFTTVALVVVALYVAWVFYSRHERSVRSEQAIAQKQDDERKRVANLIFGSGEIKYSVFSASSGVLKRGETAQLCYGVVNATSVKIEPPPEENLKPSYRHCIEIAPKTTTTYKITASNDKGESKSESLTVRVQ